MEAKDQHDTNTYKKAAHVSRLFSLLPVKGGGGVNFLVTASFTSGLRAHGCKNSQAVKLISPKSSVQAQQTAGHWNGKLTLMTVSRYPSVLSIGVSASKVFFFTNLSFRTACSCCASFSASCCSLNFPSCMATETCSRSSFCLHNDATYHQPIMNKSDWLLRHLQACKAGQLPTR